MERRLRTRGTRAAVVVVVAAGAVALAGVTPAARTAADPLRLVLQRSDMPANANWTNGRMPASFTRGLAARGVRGAKGAFHSTEIPLGTAKAKMIGGLVVVVADAANGQRAFRLFRADLASKRRDVVRLPSYGDQQVAIVKTRPTVTGEIVVRKRATVWQLEVGTSGTAVLSRAQALAELRKYAAKQKRRIGSG